MAGKGSQKFNPFEPPQGPKLPPQCGCPLSKTRPTAKEPALGAALIALLWGNSVASPEYLKLPQERHTAKSRRPKELQIHGKVTKSPPTGWSPRFKSHGHSKSPTVGFKTEVRSATQSSRERAEKHFDFGKKTFGNSNQKIFWLQFSFECWRLSMPAVEEN